jgi:hypothetical protein
MTVIPRWRFNLSINVVGCLFNNAHSGLTAAPFNGPSIEGFGAMKTVDKE